MKPEEAAASGKPVFVEPLVITTSRTFRKGGKALDEESSAENLEVRDFLVPPARVGVEIAQTVNMGNYESVRLSVMVQAPCYMEEVSEAYEHVVAFAKDRLARDRDELAAWAKKKSAQNLF